MPTPTHTPPKCTRIKENDKPIIRRIFLFKITLINNFPFVYYHAWSQRRGTKENRLLVFVTDTTSQCVVAKFFHVSPQRNSRVFSRTLDLTNIPIFNCLPISYVLISLTPNMSWGGQIIFMTGIILTVKNLYHFAAKIFRTVLCHPKLYNASQLLQMTQKSYRM